MGTFCAFCLDTDLPDKREIALFCDVLRQFSRFGVGDRVLEVPRQGSVAASRQATLVLGYERLDAYDVVTEIDARQIVTSPRA